MPEIFRFASHSDINIVLVSLLMGGSQVAESSDPPQQFAVRERWYATSVDQAPIIESIVDRKSSWITASPAMDVTTRKDISLSTFVYDSTSFSFQDFEPAPRLTSSLAQARLESALRASFDADPLEDGISHPAEEIIAEALRSEEGQRVLEWVRAYSLSAVQSSFAASVLRCLGRQTEPGTTSWRAKLVLDGLAMDDLEIRDAAVQAAELWGDSSLIDVLESHSEPVTWLQDYISDVIDDLR